MKKIKAFLGVILCVCTVFLAVACEKPLGTEGAEKFTALADAFASGELIADNADDKYHTDLTSSPYVEAYIKKAGSHVSDSDFAFSYSGIYIKFQHATAKADGTPMNVSGVMRYYKMDGVWRFMIDAEISVKTGESHWSSVSAEIYNININEYYYNGAFDVTNVTEDDIETRAVFFNQETDVPVIFEAAAACLNGINEVYSAKGYPIKKA